MKAVLAVIVAVALLAPAAATAQTQSAIDDPEANLLAELIVIAPIEGPAWWRVSKGDSVVWIMAMPASSLPTGMAWDSKALDRRLKGANAFLTFPRIQVSIGRPAKDEPPVAVPSALAARFARVRTRIGRPEGRYAEPIPARAFFQLQKDYYRWAKLDYGAGVAARVEARARRAGVAVRRPAAINGGALTPADMAPWHPGAAACLDALLDDVEVPAEQKYAAAAGWARGDLKAALTAPRDPWAICENRLFSEGSSRRAIELQVAAIERALAKPGKTVAIASLRQLLAEEGILDRLAAKGYQITAPTDFSETE